MLLPLTEKVPPTLTLRGGDLTQAACKDKNHKKMPETFRHFFFGVRPAWGIARSLAFMFMFIAFDTKE